MRNKKKYLITGATGSLGRKIISKLLSDSKKSSEEIQIIAYSRDEAKHALHFKNNKSIISVIGDVRDYEKLKTTFVRHSPDYVIHTAALKRVDDLELYPDECIKTNIQGSENVARVSLEHNVKKCILISTDKACLPVNVYGSSKFIGERIFTNYDYNSKSTIFASVRYGNVIASRGSFIPLWYDCLLNDEKISITDENMTRFLFTLDDAVETVLNSLEFSEGGEVFVPLINSYKIVDVLKSLEEMTNKKAKVEKVGIRPGEKLHEDMLAEIELNRTYFYEDLNLLQIRPQYSSRSYKDRQKYSGNHLNSSLHVNSNITEIVELITRGINQKNETISQ